MLDDTQNGNHLLPSVGASLREVSRYVILFLKLFCVFSLSLSQCEQIETWINEGFIDQLKVESNLFIEQSSYSPLLKIVFIEGLCNFQRSYSESSEVYLKPVKRQLFPAVAAPQFLQKLRLLYSLLYTCIFQYVQTRRLFLFLSYIKK